ncbi:hypothetical protein CEUSTIGMA_g107.t1 [Chlamydomonas eustigma]|uniref:EF-hand domain-containing protein n=1 Tax=Chlamydomonas eustigma TaxID=1157962 RepID=A0A250WPD5_9CHLO|nr:hypothetical protein CEUSTIGMA_g107.t1 [Chlamydomonas eustigma]|eukprot:GAX72651.1 hypothetical protein CEUSTIGMA_g107.t1 [Chlamydomonas eustigma]
MPGDDEINVDQLKVLKEIFDEADEDGGGELDIDEFCENLGPHLGGNLSLTDIRQLFLKIDADAGGTVDWEEFTNYMFLERAQEAAGIHAENWKLFPQDFRDKNEIGVCHRGPVDKVMYCEAIDRYISCSRDGTFRLWNGSDMKHSRTMSMGSSWITDCIYMPAARKLAFTTVDRAISYYETNRGSYELSGRVYASGGMGVPQSLSIVSNDAGEQLVYGDSKGHVVMLLCGTREWPARDLISTEEHQDYIYIHQEHSDWVSQVTWVPEIGLVSSSVDSTIKIYDFVREKVTRSCTQHSKAVHGFIWCSAYTLFASCGVERDIFLWQGQTARRVGELTGHTASVTHLALDEKLNHVFSLSADKMIKVWDLRNHKCLQTISSDDWVRREESRPHCLMYDQIHRRAVTAMTKPYVWVHKMVAQDRTGHMDSVKGAIYNATFDVIVSADESGTVCVWKVGTGAREGRFNKAHGDAKLTALCFDKNERRLVTAGGDGTVFMWNFNNGSKLREYAHDDEKLEIVSVIFAADEKRESDAIYAAGWNCKVFVWEDLDDDNETIREYRTFEGHREDITHMAAYPKRQLLATGDYEGRITIWNLFTGEKRMCLFHRAERYETLVDCLMWLPLKGRLPRRSTAGQSFKSTLDQDEEVDSAMTDVSPLSNMSPIALLSTGGDGLLRVWLVGSVGKLVCTMPAAQGKLEQVSSIGRDRNYDNIVIGDTAGHIRVWDISRGINTSSAEACRSSFVQRSHWRAHQHAINSVDIVPERNLVIAACKDHNVTIWTLDGAMLGTLGEDEWVLDDLRTWRDPDGEDKVPPMGDADNLFLQGTPEGPAHEEGEDEEEAAYMETGTMQMASALLSERKLRQRDGVGINPVGLHSQLKVHELQEVPSNVRELLRSEGPKGTSVISNVKRPSLPSKAAATQSKAEAAVAASLVTAGSRRAK